MKFLTQSEAQQYMSESHKTAFLGQQLIIDNIVYKVTHISDENELTLTKVRTIVRRKEKTNES